MAGLSLVTARDTRGRPMCVRYRDADLPVDALAHEMGWRIRMALVEGENAGTKWERYRLVVDRCEAAGHEFDFAEEA